MFENINVTEAFKRTVTAALHTGTLSHALILEGKDEETRTATANEIAKAVLCEGENKPCGNCIRCRKVTQGIHPDIHILEKENNSSMIKIEAVRELKKKALVYPNDGNKSIFIIKNAEEMNPQAQNAFLKIFEEPAPHLLFILCCKSKSSLLDTIISRATLYSLGEETGNEAVSEKEKKACELASELLICLADDNELNFLKKIAVFTRDKELFRLTLQNMQLIIRDGIVLQNGGKEILSDGKPAAERLKARLTTKKTFELGKAVTELYENSLMNSNHNLTLTRFSSLFYGIKSH